MNRNFTLQLIEILAKVYQIIFLIGKKIHLIQSRA